MRRLLALLGAMALTVLGLAGPAHASDAGVTQVNVAFGTVQPHGTSPHTDASFQLNNLDLNNPADLQGYWVDACVGTSSSSITLATYGPADTINAGGTFLTADAGFSGGGTPDYQPFDTSGGFSDPSNYEIALFDPMGVQAAFASQGSTPNCSL